MMLMCSDWWDVHSLWYLDEQDMQPFIYSFLEGILPLFNAPVHDKAVTWSPLQSLVNCITWERIDVLNSVTCWPAASCWWKYRFWYRTWTSCRLLLTLREPQTGMWKTGTIIQLIKQSYSFSLKHGAAGEKPVSSCSLFISGAFRILPVCPTSDVIIATLSVCGSHTSIKYG